MKEETPFNPIPIPNLNLPASEPQPAPPEIKTSRSKTAPRRKPRSPKTRRPLDPKASAIRFGRKMSRKAKTSWNRIKNGVQSRMAGLDSEQLKRILIACGIAAAVVLIIVVLAKHTLLIVVLLTVLGAAVVLKLWSRLLTLGI